MVWWKRGQEVSKGEVGLPRCLVWLHVASRDLLLMPPSGCCRPVPPSPLSSPSENVRDHVMAASRALLSGDWQRACALTQGMEVWRLLPEEQRQSVQVMLRERIQLEALRAFLFAASAAYHSVSLDQLVEVRGGRGVRGTSRWGRWEDAGERER